MTIFARLSAAASLLAVAAAVATPANAAGTTAGSTITNNVSVAYQVGGVSQTAVTASDTFTVDRKINLTTAEIGNLTTSVSPGQTSAVTSFTVTNSSNAPLDFALSASQQVGGTAVHGGTDSFDTTNVKIYVDTNNDNVFSVGDTQVTYLDQVAADATIKVFVVSDVPLGLATGAVADVRLTATASEATAAGSLGATVTQTSGANTAGVDTVFADTIAGGNTARDGISFANDDYTVSAAAVTATKVSRIVSDPFNGSTNPKLIPGAVVEYCIAVSNGAGSADATSVAISDTLPTATTYEPLFGVKVNGTVTGATCNADGAIAGSQASGVVTGTIPTIVAGATRTVLFRVTIN
jgi:hypothetical protein